MALQGTQSLKHCIVSINGLPITGAAEGEFINITYSQPVYTFQEGADGELHRSKTGSTVGTITISVYQTSLSARRILDNVVRIQEAAVPNSLNEDPTLAKISVRNLATNEVYECNQCSIETRPTMSQGRDSSPRQYVFRSPNIQQVS